MARGKPPPGLSVIEQMAALHHERDGSIIRWDQLSKEDRLKLMGRMQAAVEIIPDKLLLKAQGAAATVATGDARDALLADHEQAKRSSLSGI